MSKTEIAGEVAKGAMSSGAKWMIGLGGTALAGFTTVILATGTPKKPDTPVYDGTAETSEDRRTGKKGEGKNTPPPPSAYSPVSAGADASVDEQIKIQQMNLEGMRRDMQQMQNYQTQMYEDMIRRMEAVQQDQIKAAAMPKIDVPQLQRTSRLSERYTGEYQQKINHFKGNKGNYWSLGDAQIKDMVEKAKTQTQPVASVPYLQSTGYNMPTVELGQPKYSYILQAGTRIIAVTEQPVNSDHPGYFTSKIVRPDVLRGALLICQNGGQVNDRIPVNVAKIVFNGAEYTISGQVEMGFPGVTGKINRHYGTRFTPLVANAAITGGFVAWSMNNSGDRIDTRDAITAEIVGQTVPQVQNEIAKFGVSRPNTVEVAAGTQFSILLMDRLTVEY